MKKLYLWRNLCIVTSFMNDLLQWRNLRICNVIYVQFTSVTGALWKVSSDENIDRLVEMGLVTTLIRLLVSIYLQTSFKSVPKSKAILKAEINYLNL